MIWPAVHDRYDSDCLHRNVAPAAIIVRDGSRHYRTRCFDCGCLSAQSISADVLRRHNIDPATLEVVRDDREPDEPCEVCGSDDGVQLHHWAPQSLEQRFRSPQAWPTAMLCRTCHAEWHRAVTPDLVAHAITLFELGARRSTTVRELADMVRDRLAGVTAKRGAA